MMDEAVAMQFDGRNVTQTSCGEQGLELHRTKVLTAVRNTAEEINLLAPEFGI
jgi:hypothetical protein